MTSLINTIVASPSVSLNGFTVGDSYLFVRQGATKVYRCVNDKGFERLETESTLLKGYRSSLLWWKTNPWSYAGTWDVVHKSCQKRHTELFHPKDTFFDF